MTCDIETRSSHVSEAEPLTLVLARLRRVGCARELHWEVLTILKAKRYIHGSSPCACERSYYYGALKDILPRANAAMLSATDSISGPLNLAIPSPIFAIRLGCRSPRTSASDSRRALMACCCLVVEASLSMAMAARSTSFSVKVMRSGARSLLALLGLSARGYDWRAHTVNGLVLIDAVLMTFSHVFTQVIFPFEHLLLPAFSASETLVATLFVDYSMSLKVSRRANLFPHPISGQTQALCDVL